MLMRRKLITPEDWAKALARYELEDPHFDHSSPADLLKDKKMVLHGIAKEKETTEDGHIILRDLEFTHATIEPNDDTPDILIPPSIRGFRYTAKIKPSNIKEIIE